VFSIVDGRDGDLFQNIMDKHAGSVETSGMYANDRRLVREDRLKEVEGYVPTLDQD
jgi:creatinine amidohydrolase/Fe(II)-dependent formamide hydrolase-like protein